MYLVRIVSTGLLCAGILLLSSVATVSAQLTVEITSGNDDATPIAVVPFAREAVGALPVDVASIIRANMNRSGRFKALSPDDMLSLPSLGANIVYTEWRRLRAEYLVLGKVQPTETGLHLEYAVHSVAQRQVIDKGEIYSDPEHLRQSAHRLSDAMYLRLTGTRGAFATRIAYTLRQEKAPHYAMHVADADGGNDEVLFRSTHPILSPQWSSNAAILAYVGFELGYPSVFLYNLKKKRATPLLKGSEYSSAPAWSPDGKYLAVVLARSSNPDIYLVQANGTEVKRLTKHFGIDTEPSFTADGKHLLFTSDRNGTPQIYRIRVNGGSPERLTDIGNYNARAISLPNSNGMIMVHGNKGEYHIARQNFEDARVQVLSNTVLDESPTVAPNGHMLMYASNYRGHGVMIVVSIPNSSAARLQSYAGEVGDPTWSPFLY